MEDEKNGEGVSESPSEETAEESKPPQEGDNTPVKPEPTPLHKDERFREVYRGYKDGQRKIAELERQIKDISETRTTKTEEPSKPPQWFTEAFGDNPQLYQNYLTHSKAERESLKAELRADLEKESHADTTEIETLQSEFSDRMDEMADDGLEFDRNELMKFASENPIMGKDGYIDLRKCLEWMQKSKTATPNAATEARKKITATGAANAAEPKSKDVFSNKDFEHMGWGGLK